MVKRRPAPNVDPAAVAAFVEAADAPVEAPSVTPVAVDDVPAPEPEPTPADKRAARRGRDAAMPTAAKLATPGPRSARAPEPAGEKLPTTMLLRFKEPLDEARMIAELAEHYDRSKQYIAYNALVRGLDSMKAEAGLS